MLLRRTPATSKHLPSFWPYAYSGHLKAVCVITVSSVVLFICYILWSSRFLTPRPTSLSSSVILLASTWVFTGFILFLLYYSSVAFLFLSLYFPDNILISFLVYVGMSMMEALQCKGSTFLNPFYIFSVAVIVHEICILHVLFF